MFEQFKVLVTYTFFLAFIVNVPYSHASITNYIGVKNIKKIDYVRALEFINKQNAVLFDARIPERYNREHIPGALNFPYFSFKEYYIKYSEKLTKERPVITYCDDSDCNAAQKLAIKIIQKGFKNVYTIEEGYQGWEKRMAKLNRKKN